jgi:hypothetical protein
VISFFTAGFGFSHEDAKRAATASKIKAFFMIFSR